MLRRLQGLKERRRAGQASYSQSGEDMILRFIMGSLKIEQPRYIDIGAHDPIRINNTYSFYERGSRGVCVEPNPLLAARHRRLRPRDLLVEAGAGAASRPDTEFFLIDPDTLSTFSRAEAERIERETPHRIRQVLRVPIIAIGELINEHFDCAPDIVSIDVEFLDLELLRGIDYERRRPVALCVETLTFTTDRTEKKVGEIPDFMAGVGYMAYADTYINTIFVDAKRWRAR